MAAHLITWQLPTGAWSYKFNQPPEKNGITEKGTALWSLLFYQLYHATCDEIYLEAARKALEWCLENQYTGPDSEAIGGLIGVIPHSAIDYMSYFNVTCAYASGFFGLAIPEELKIIGPSN